MVWPAKLTQTQSLHFTEGGKLRLRGHFKIVFVHYLETQCGIFKHLILSHSLFGKIKPLLQRREAKQVQMKKHLEFLNFAAYLARTVQQVLCYRWDITRPGSLKV